MSEKGAGSSGGSPQSSTVTVSDVQELIRRKEEIEAQIKANYDVLESVSVGSGAPGHRRGRPKVSGLGPTTWEVGGPGGLRRRSQLWVCTSLGAQGAAPAASVGSSQ